MGGRWKASQAQESNGRGVLATARFATELCAEQDLEVRRRCGTGNREALRKDEEVRIAVNTGSKEQGGDASPWKVGNHRPSLRTDGKLCRAGKHLGNRRVVAA